MPLAATSSSSTSARADSERFDPNGIRQLKEIAERDIAIGGADLAGQAMKAGLVDEYHLLISPVFVGGGHKALPDEVRMNLELQDHRSFSNGVVHLHYRLPMSEGWPTHD